LPFERLNDLLLPSEQNIRTRLTKQKGERKEEKSREEKRRGENRRERRYGGGERSGGKEMGRSKQ
jgi:hypothetical protein